MSLFMVPVLLAALLPVARWAKVKDDEQVEAVPRERDWRWPEPWHGQVCLRPEHPRVTFRTVMPATSSFARFAPVDRPSGVSFGADRPTERA